MKLLEGGKNASKVYNNCVNRPLNNKSNQMLTRVRIRGQTSKQNMNKKNLYISSAISSRQIFRAKTPRANKPVMKNFLKNLSFGVADRSCHSRYKK